jgi:hypothetical protein
MPLLFFVAGYFSVPSLQGKGPGRLAVNKVFRLVIPAAAVFVLHGRRALWVGMASWGELRS